MAKEKLLTLPGLQSYDAKSKARMEANDTEILKQAKEHAEGLGGTLYDEAGIAQTKMEELANGAVADNTSAIEKLNGDAETEGSVAKAVTDAVKTETDARTEAVKAVQDEVDALEQTHVTDKEALEASIKGITDDYLKASDKTELQGNIDTVNAAVERLTNGVSADEVDGVNDLIQYVKDHGTEVTGMQEGIADNAEAIESVAGRATTLEGEMDAVEAAVATKVEQETYNTKVAALEGEDTAIKGRLDALEEAVGEGGSVYTQISEAIGELDSDVVSAEVDEGKGLKVQVVETDGKLVSVAVTGNYDNSYDAKGAADTAKSEAIASAAEDATTKANTAEANAKAAVTELADGAVKTNADAITAINNEETGILAQAKAHADGKDEAIQTAQTTADNAVSAVTALEEGQVADNASAIADLQGLVGEGYEIITTDEINAMFAEEA